MPYQPRINGTLQPIRTSRRQSYDPSKGLTSTQEYESAGENLSGLAAECIANRIQFDHVLSGRKSRLIFSSSDNFVGGEDIIVDTWELMANEAAQDVKAHPNVRALPATGTGSLQDVLDQVQSRSENKNFVPTVTGNALLLFNLLIHGTTSYQVGQYALRHTTNVANAYAENISDINVESVYTTAQLVTEISDPLLWTVPAPGRLIYKIENIEVQVETDDDIIWGWRKLPSTETTAANNRINISTEYVLYGWSKLLYATI